MKRYPRARLGVSLIQTPDVQSSAALLLLNKDLLKQDETIDWVVWLNFREKYLSEVLERDGVLRCAYCNKHNLVIDTQDRRTLATIDHVIPTSKGGPMYDANNMVVSCYRCNQNKDDSLKDR